MKTNTKNLDQQIAALMKLRDQDIDTSDIPEVKDWTRAVVGKFYRPLKEPVTLRIDGDVLGWLKSEGPGYQTRINTLLRAVMAGRSSGAVSEISEMGASASEATAVFRFPSLERHGELEKYDHIAELISERHSLFVCAR